MLKSSEFGLVRPNSASDQVMDVRVRIEVELRDGLRPHNEYKLERTMASGLLARIKSVSLFRTLEKLHSSCSDCTGCARSAMAVTTSWPSVAAFKLSTR